MHALLSCQSNFSRTKGTRKGFFLEKNKCPPPHPHHLPCKSMKGGVVILVTDTSFHPILHFYQVPSKYSKGYSSYRVDTKSISNKTKRNNSKSKKARVVILLHDMSSCRLVLFYISTKYHQNIPKGIQVTERTRSFTQTLMPTPKGSVPKKYVPRPFGSGAT